MSKSGLINKVTAERYRTIKHYIEERELSCSDDVMVGKVFGVGRTTVRTIRNTRDYEEYQTKTKSYHKPKKSNNSRQVVLPSSGLPLEELPIRCKRQLDSSAVMLGGIGATVLIILIILAIIVTLLVIKEFYGA